MGKQRRPATRSNSTHRYPRTARLSETLREIIAEELVRIDDERLDLVTVTRIDTDPELNGAVVFFDSLDGEGGDQLILEAFADHRKRLQASIAKQIRAKKTPILSFQPDDVIRAAERIDVILRERGTLPERPVDDLSEKYVDLSEITGDLADSAVADPSAAE
jgi:ribosome-binding factor A